MGTASHGAAYTAEDHAARCRELLQTSIKVARARRVETLPLTDAADRVLASAVRSAIALPPFDNSQMDGYAVCAEDLACTVDGVPMQMPIGVATAAGDAPNRHEPGTASPVMTGAPVPEGADAIVPIEDALPPEFPPLTRALAGAGAAAEPSGVVAFAAPVAPGVFVRRAGSDLAQGDTILPEGACLTPARIGALAAAGVAQVEVLPRLQVLLCSTGDELSEAGPLLPGRVYDANTPMLAAAIRATGAEVRTVRIDDDVEAFRAAILAEAQGAGAQSPDAIVTTGGVSEGAFEVVREALTLLGVEFMRVAMQPGGPQGCGRIPTPTLCFPGNPVSAMLSAELFLLPALRAAAGRTSERPRETRPLAHDVDSPVGKLQLRRGRIEADGRVRLSGPSSHLIAGLAAAEVIAEIPIGVDRLVEDSPVSTWRIND